MTVELETRRMFEEVLGCKWTLAILDALAAGVARPGKLRRAMAGLTSKVLQDRLRKLERFELVKRELVTQKPLHVEYRLTRKGRELSRIVVRLRGFADRWSAE